MTSKVDVQQVDKIARLIEPSAWAQFDASCRPYAEGRGAQGDDGEQFWYGVTYRSGCRSTDDVRAWWETEEDNARLVLPVFAWRDSLAKATAILEAQTISPATAEERDEWQPFETAPKDGSRLLLCWDDCPTLSAHVELAKWSATKGWCNTYGHPFSGVATHWMPLPAIRSRPSASTDGDG